MLIDYFSRSISCPDPNDTTNWIALQVDTEDNSDKVRTLVILEFRSDVSCRF